MSKISRTHIPLTRSWGQVHRVLTQPRLDHSDERSAVSIHSHKVIGPAPSGRPEFTGAS